MAKKNEVKKNKLYEVGGASKWTGHCFAFLGTKLLQLLILVVFVGVALYLQTLRMIGVPGAWYVNLANDPLAIVFLVVGMFICGFAFCWAAIIGIKYNTKNIIVNGQRMKFTGSTIPFCFTCLKWVILSVITVGIYLFYLPVAVKKWKYSHMTSVEDEASVPQNQVTYYIVD